MKVLLALLVSILLFSPVSAQSPVKPVREAIEWLDVWMPNTNDSGLPRILLIGNSITRGYYPEVAKLLTGKAFVARLATSKSIGDPGLLKEIALVMSYYKFDIVHFNNGLHGWGYTEAEYAKAFPDFLKQIRKGAPKAKLVWATITPVRLKGDVIMFDERTERIKVRNKIALDIIARYKDIVIDDLWSLTAEHADYFEGGDGTHPNPAGYRGIAEKVAAVLSNVLQQK